MIDFRNYKDLMESLKDEKVCREHMEEMRWGCNPICPYCGAAKPYRIRNGKAFRCKDKTCKRDFTVTIGTVFENSKIPLSTWIAATFVLTAHKKCISSHQLARDLGITQKSAWFLLHRLRYIADEEAPETLDKIVEVEKPISAAHSLI
ncbi:MAG: IS1595 family transposase [Parafilimonas sp.]